MKNGNVAGHGDPKTTKRYTHFSVEETRAPFEALDEKGGLKQIGEVET